MKKSYRAFSILTLITCLLTACFNGFESRTSLPSKVKSFASSPARMTHPDTVFKQPDQQQQLVSASFYGSSKKFKGKKTACGEPFNPNAHTAAHKTYPFGTLLEVTNPENDKSVTVRINDRGPFVKGRALDLSHGAAKALDMTQNGVQKVKVRLVALPETKTQQ